jgi:hypothetical protein
MTCRVRSGGKGLAKYEDGLTAAVAQQREGDGPDYGTREAWSLAGRLDESHAKAFKVKRNGWLRSHH